MARTDLRDHGPAERRASRRPVCLAALAALAACAAPATAPKPPAGSHRAEAAPAEIARVPPAALDPVDSGELDLEELLDLADARNPRISAARAELGAASGRIEQARLWPNPALELEAEDVPSGGGGLGEGKRTVGLSLPLALGGRRGAAAEVARAEERALAHAFDAVRRAVHGEVRRARVELLHLRAAAALQVELSDSARETLATARTRFEARASPEAEVLRADIEVRELELSARRLAARRSAEIGRLAALLGGISVDPERLAGELDPVPLDPGLAALLVSVRATHPALLAALAEIDAAERRIELARAEGVPDLELFLAIGREGPESGGIVEGGLSIPLPLFDRRQGAQREARELATRARRDAEAISAELAADTAAAHSELAAARDEAAAYRDAIVPGAARALEQTGEAYRAGRGSLLDVLDAQRALAEARLALAEAVRGANAAHSRLVDLAGAAALESAEMDQRPRGEPDARAGDARGDER